MPKYENFLHKTERCPLCKGTRSSLHSQPPPNRYSEAIAAHVKVAEETLLNVFENLICSDCGLIYKKSWFNSEVLLALFNDLIPLHPRGWDTVSGRFSPETFFHELGLYKDALKTNDIENINRYRRALPSILDSIQDPDLLFDREAAMRHIATGELDYFVSEAENIKASFKKPKPFKRFSGYDSDALWEYATRLAQPVNSYAEIGCPLWGMLRKSSELGLKTVYTKKKEVNFWTDKCRNEEMTCLQKCASLLPAVEIVRWADLKSRKVDLMGVYQYIDHLEQPMDFFEQLFERTRAVISVIDDAYSSPSCIQHFTGWTPKAIKFVADAFGKKVDDSFVATKEAGHNTYIFH